MKEDLENNPEFEEYRRKMHHNMATGEDNTVDPRPARKFSPLQVAFGIFMIIVYVGMGVLLMMNFFGAPDTAAWTIGRWIVGIVLVIYGFWRAYRMIAGIDSRL